MSCLGKFYCCVTYTVAAGLLYLFRGLCTIQKKKIMYYFDVRIAMAFSLVDNAHLATVCQ